MSHYLELIAVVVGVMLFLWSTAVIATGFAMGISEGRLRRRESYQFIAAIIIFVLCTIGYSQIEADLQLPAPEADLSGP
jgi:hypothetical protein